MNAQLEGEELEELSIREKTIILAEGVMIGVALTLVLLLLLTGGAITAGSAESGGLSREVGLGIYASLTVVALWIASYLHRQWD